MPTIGREPASGSTNLWRGRYAPAEPQAASRGRQLQRHSPERYRYNPPGRTLGGRYRVGNGASHCKTKTCKTPKHGKTYRVGGQSSVTVTLNLVPLAIVTGLLILTVRGFK